MENFLNTETLIIELLLIVSLVALIVVGLLITFQQPKEISYAGIDFIFVYSAAR